MKIEMASFVVVLVAAVDVDFVGCGSRPWRQLEGRHVVRSRGAQVGGRARGEPGHNQGGGLIASVSGSGSVAARILRKSVP